MADYIEATVEQDPVITAELQEQVVLPEVISVNGKSGVVVLTTSDLQNDSGFITNTVNDLVNYYKKTDTYTKSEVNNLIAGQLKFEIVDILPATGQPNIIYLVPSSQSETGNVKDEYIWLNNAWEKIGSTAVDLSNYYTKAQSDAKFVEKQAGKGLSKNDYSDEEKAKVTANTSARHSHSNKELLDSYDQTNEDLADAVNKKHNHSNKALLDTYNQTNANLSDAVAKKHTHANKEELDSIASGDKAKWDSHTVNKNNPHEVTKAQVGLGNVENKSSADIRGEITVANIPTLPQSKITDLETDLSGIDERIDDIEELIPSQASSSNILADKNFVNSSIATETAHYISNNGEPFTSVEQLEAYSGTVTNNDYAFVSGTDSTGNAYYDRYKATVPKPAEASSIWAKEYRLNNSSFTAQQWATVNSGITALLVSSYNLHIADGTIHVTTQNKTDWNAKYNKPATGIPSTDMTSAVVTSLGKADSSLQPSDIVNDLTTGGATKALSAEQGKQLATDKVSYQVVGQASGVCGLDANSKVADANINYLSSAEIDSLWEAV